MATTNVPAGGNLQAAINAAAPGDTLVLAANATFVGNFSLPNKSGNATITIMSAGTLPPVGQRVSPAAATHFAKLQAADRTHCVYTLASAHDYTFLGIEFVGGVGDAGGAIIELGDATNAQSTYDVVPWRITLDRCYIHGDPVKGQKRGVIINMSDVTIKNCYIADCKYAGEDSQAIVGWNGPGPFTIVNNYLEGAGENFILGGADPRIPGMIPADLLFLGNYVTKPVSWLTEGWQIKNLLELKNCQRAVLRGNIFENSWVEAQTGFIVLFTPRNQEGTAPWSNVTDVLFEYNIVRHGAAAFNISGHDDAESNPVIAARITIRHNLFYDIAWSWGVGASGNFCVAVLGPMDQVIFDHNTIIQQGDLMSADLAAGALTNFVWTNTLALEGTYGWIATDRGIGTDSINFVAPGRVWAGNVVAGSAGESYPSGTQQPDVTTFLAHFTNPAANDYSLIPTSTYRNAGTDGQDLGADIAQVMRATATVLSGAPAFALGKVRIKRSVGVTTRAVLRSSDILYRGAIRMPNSSIDTSATYGGMTGRVVGGQTHVFLYDSISATAAPNVWELDITGLTPSLDYTTAPRASVVRNWGQIYGSARASWTPAGDLKNGFAANFNAVGQVCLHWHEPSQRLYWSFVDFYNVNGDPDWTMGMSTLNDSDGSSVGYGPYRLKATDRDGTAWYGHRSYFFFEHPTTGKMLTGGIAHSGDASVPYGPSCYGDADWPTPTTPGGHNAANDITLASRYLDYYCMNGSFAQSTGNYFNLNGSWNGVIRSFQFDGVLTYPIEYFPTNYTQARVDPTLNGGKGSWQGSLCSMNDAFWFEGTRKRGVLYVGVLAAGYSASGSDPNASHTWYRNVGLGHDTCMHGFSCVQCASAGDSSTKTIPAFIIFDPDRLASNKLGNTLDYTTEASQIIDAELTYGIRTCSQDKLQAKSLSGAWLKPGSTRFYVNANTADISRAGEAFPETLIHVFDITD
jgi:hypothetical protein